MILRRQQIVRRIVGGADRRDAEFLHDSLGGKFRQRQVLVGDLPHAIRALGIQQLANAEVAQQLQMRPVIERVAERLRHRLRPGAELFRRGGIAGDEALRHAIRAHRPPFVMVALEPNLEEIPKLPILGDILGRKVAVVIEDRLGLRKLVVKAARRHRAEEKVVVDELHGEPPDDRQ